MQQDIKTTLGLDKDTTEKAYAKLEQKLQRYLDTYEAALHAHIFVFDFMDFSVSEQQRFR